MTGYRIENLATQRVIENYTKLNTPFQPAGVLPVPYVSQKEAGADLAPGDCGPTCVAMILKAYRPGYSVPVNVLFKRVVLYNDLLVKNAKNEWAGFGDLVTLLNEEGLDSVVMRQLTMPVVFSLLKAGRPILALVNYKLLKDAGFTEDKQFTRNHFMLVVGIDGDVIYVHDPYCSKDGGEAVPFPVDVFNQAWKTGSDFKGLVPVRSLYPEENAPFPVLFRILLTGNRFRYLGPDLVESTTYPWRKDYVLDIYEVNGQGGKVVPWPGQEQWIDLSNYVAIFPQGTPQRVLTDMETSVQRTFNDLAGGLRPLRLLQVPFVDIGSIEGQTMERASAAACGAALIQARKADDRISAASLLDEMNILAAEEQPVGQLVAALTEHNTPTVWKPGLTLYDLFTSLQENKPLILELNSGVLDTPGQPSGEGTRFVILIGMDNRYACFHDPADPAGEARCLPLASFEKALNGADSFSALVPVNALSDPGPRHVLNLNQTRQKVAVMPDPGSENPVRTLEKGEVIPIFQERIVEKEIAGKTTSVKYGMIGTGQWIIINGLNVTSYRDPESAPASGGQGAKLPGSVPAGSPVGIPASAPLGEAKKGAPAANEPFSQPGVLYRVKLIGNLKSRSKPDFKAKIVNWYEIEDVFEILEERNSLGRIGDNEWISLSPAFVKKI